MGLFKKLFKPNIQMLKAEKDFDGLIEALGDKKKDLRREATKALGELGDIRAVEPLIGALRDDAWDVRREAAKALGELGDIRAVEPLIGALSDEGVVRFSKSVQARMAVNFDPQSQWSKGLTPLLAAGRLEDQEISVRRDAAFALAKLHDPRAVDPLIQFTKGEDPVMRRIAAIVLGDLGAPRAVEALIPLLSDETWGVRSRAAEALGKLGVPQAVDSLLGAVRDADPLVRWAAVQALGKIGDPRTIDLLKAAMLDEDENVRDGARQALERMHICVDNPPTSEALSDDQMFEALAELCDAYVCNDEPSIARLEPIATRIGEELNRRGGIEEMRKMWKRLGGRRGARTLDMHWGGIGEWRG